MSDSALAPVVIRTLTPALIVLGTGVLVLVLDLLPPRNAKDHLGAVALWGVVVSLLGTLWGWDREGRGFHGMILLDHYALFFDIVIGYATALVLLLSMDYVRRAGAQSGEYYALVLFAATGMMLLTSAGDLIVVFLALELTSLSLYVLSGVFKGRREAGRRR